MGYRVKCQVTEVYGDSDNFYKARDGKYYQSKEIYKQHRREQLAYKKANDILMDVLKLKTYPPVLGKFIKELHENHSYEVIYLTVCDVKSNIEYALHNKKFNNDYAMLSYVNAILKNRVNEIENIYQNRKHSSTPKIEIDEDVFENQRKNTHKKRDISKWLE